MHWQLSLKPGAGLRAERCALRYLRRQGLRLKARNYACYFGEVDLIMADKRHLIFIEVRLRKQGQYGKAEETVNYQKQQRVMRSAQYYLQSECISTAVDVRFDVIAITSDLSGVMQVNWIKNAFGN